MKKITGILAICLLSLFVLPANSNAQVVVSIKPVAPKVKIVKPRCPAPNYVWISGQWIYNPRKGKYVWKDGYWTKKKKGKKWVSGHWKRVPFGYKWVPGHWA